ncbi:glutathione binding-like protein [Actibacterium sp. 188UL27-1]|uniref:glutathione binding-like protein n=1 Tax=Actibacterium sp. 188UL27-1 TaxID=2786961 RepID=UPI0019566AED|nr:glutathione binding-like protein [Actibacterium sp. 188UL27-1]MBM7066068.1 hypothetical protein [Actibacterium sp. 188UL27-1]
MSGTMPVTYVDTATAIARSGLRMTVVEGVPSPWGEAAKGIWHVKDLPWVATRLDPTDPVQVEWTGRQSAPVVLYDKEPPRDRWIDILLLAERLAPSPALVPKDPVDRALAIGLSHEICGEHGLAWSRRLWLTHLGLNGRGGFSAMVSAYLAAKYAYDANIAQTAPQRIRALLGLFAARLKAQRARGSDYLMGDGISCVDIYLATAMALFRPLPQAQCEMRAQTRTAFETTDPETEAALDPILLKHRDAIYARHLELPLSL